MIDPNIALSVQPPKPLDIAGAFQKAANLRSMANQETIQKQAIEQNAQAIRDQQLVRKAWIEANGKDEDFLTRIKTAGVSPDTFQRYEAAYQERRGRMAATNADELKAQQLRWGNLRSLFLTVLDEKDETKSKALMNRAFEMAKAQKLITDEELKRIQGIMDKGWNREDAQMYINSLSSELNLSEEVLKPVEVQPGNTLVDPNTGKPIFTAPAKVTEPTGDYREFLQTYYPGWLESNGKTKSATNEMKAWQDFVKDKRTSKLLTPEEEAQQIRIYNQKQSLSANSGSDLTEEGLDLAARQFATTGSMPAMGMGAAKLRSRIINRAAELYPDLDIASNQAEFSANKASLNQLQKSYDAIVSFERTAQRNLDIMLEAAKNIVDTNSPLLNKPIRSLQERVFGNKDIPAFRAARRIDVNEIAKIVSNPNMTGILTNEAREEINGLVPDSVTMGQLVSVAKLLRRDMNNRKTSMEEQMEAIKKRIGEKRNSTNENKSTAISVSYQGKTYTFPDQKSADGFKNEMGIK